MLQKGLYFLSRIVSSRPKERSVSSDTPTFDELDAPPSFGMFALPLELQGEILCLLDHGDIFNLRLTSKSFLRLLRMNEHFVVRHLWHDHFSYGDYPCLCPSRPTFASAANMPTKPTFDDYFRLLQQEKAAATLAETLHWFVEAKVFHHNLRFEADPMAGSQPNLVERLRLALMHLQTYWTEYRHLLEGGLSDGSFVNDADRQRQLLKRFCIPCLLECYGAFELLFLAITMKLRPKTYAGSLERAVRRWRGEPVPMRELVMLFIYGGFDMINYLLRLKPYVTRRVALSQYMKNLTTNETLCTPMPPEKPNKRDVFELIDVLERNFSVKVPENWWLRLQLPKNEHSTVTAHTQSPATLAVRRKVFHYLAMLEAGQFFKCWEAQLLQARKDKRRPLLGGWEWTFYAMHEPPWDLDFEKIQEDWTTYYAPRERLGFAIEEDE